MDTNLKGYIIFTIVSILSGIGYFFLDFVNYAVFGPPEPPPYADEYPIDEPPPYVDEDPFDEPPIYDMREQRY